MKFKNNGYMINFLNMVISNQPVWLSSYSLYCLYKKSIIIKFFFYFKYNFLVKSLCLYFSLMLLLTFKQRFGFTKLVWLNDMYVKLAYYKSVKNISNNLNKNKKIWNKYFWFSINLIYNNYFMMPVLFCGNVSNFSVFKFKNRYRFDLLVAKKINFNLCFNNYYNLLSFSKFFLNLHGLSLLLKKSMCFLFVSVDLNRLVLSKLKEYKYIFFYLFVLINFLRFMKIIDLRIYI